MRADPGLFASVMKSTGLGFFCPVEGSGNKGGPHIDKGKTSKRPGKKQDTVFDLIGRVEAAERRNGLIKE